MSQGNSPNYFCPICSCHLTQTKDKTGASWACPTCRGCAIKLGLLQKISKPELVAELWKKAWQENRQTGKACPACRKAMLLVMAQPKLGSVELDVCASCQFVWFDKSELEKIPRASLGGNTRAESPKQAKPTPSAVAQSGPLLEILELAADEDSVVEDAVDLIVSIF